MLKYDVTHKAFRMNKVTMKTIRIFLVALPLAVSAQQSAGQKASAQGFSEMTTLEQFGGPSLGTYAPSLAEKKRIAWYQEARFGMFIHWGLYSKMAGYWKGEKVYGGEWALKLHKLPLEEYRELAKEFNPLRFNAEEWVSVAKMAGMKYIVITAKHHDGFAMFKSRASAYNIVDATPFQRDPIQELKEACDRQGIRFGIYYSHAQDWDERDAYGNNWSFSGYQGDIDVYLEKKALPQIREICEQYHPAIMWYDTPGGMTLERAQHVAEVTRRSSPDVLINSRIFSGPGSNVGLWDYTNGGDNEAFEQYSNVPWELCGTMNQSWAYKKWDTDFRPVSELLYHLIDAVSKNGNYLLNIGPDGEGEISLAYTVRLRQIGKWLAVNGEAIYGCHGTAFGTEFGEYHQVDGKRKFVAAPANWRCTTKPGEVYIHILNWPEDGQLELPALKAKIKSATFLANANAKIRVEQTRDRTILTMPRKAPDEFVSIVKLSL
ncbi:alpha-L-fucosidase [Chryseolinea lacunae]|uniref:alpha-L-fucosidase n=1 Tax=Chryseolinea lacunae TaxID=2801331 RepID=A0ABS1L5E7_9BACT|nr:alpha-L-fucosidase [Chryseolinea lacunae]MBL0745776.1 alpha-L-fucosidase [Chryseolinea lacunae]